MSLQTVASVWVDGHRLLRRVDQAALLSGELVHLSFNDHFIRLGSKGPGLCLYRLDGHPESEQVALYGSTTEDEWHLIDGPWHRGRTPFDKPTTTEKK